MKVSQHGSFFNIPFTVFIDFILPPFRSGLRYLKILTPFMAMPEATVNKKYGSVFGKYDVGFSWKVFNVQAEP